MSALFAERKEETIITKRQQVNALSFYLVSTVSAVTLLTVETTLLVSLRKCYLYK